MKKNLDKTSSKSILNEFFQKSPTHMVIVNPEDGTTVDANKSYLDFYGHSRNKVIGKTAVELGHMDNEEQKKVLNRIKETGRADNILVKVKGKNNELSYVLLNVVPIVVKKRILFLTFGTDISSSILGAKKQRDDIIKIFDSCDDEGVILISVHDVKHPSLLYANDKAKIIIKKLSLKKLINKVDGNGSALLTVASKSYHVRKVGNNNSSHIKLIVMRPLLDGSCVKEKIKEYNFTSRQKEVAILTAAGHSNSEIAKSLCISEYTVKDHLKEIFNRIGIRNRSELFPKLLNLRQLFSLIISN